MAIVRYQRLAPIDATNIPPVMLWAHCKVEGSNDA